MQRNGPHCAQQVTPMQTAGPGSESRLSTDSKPLPCSNGRDECGRRDGTQHRLAAMLVPRTCGKPHPLAAVHSIWVTALK